MKRISFSAGELIFDQDDASEHAYQPIYEKYGEKLFAVADNKMTDVSAQETCDMAIEIYENIFRLPEKEAGPLLRYMLSEE